MNLKVFTDATIKRRDKLTKNLEAAFGGCVINNSGDVLFNFYDKIAQKNIDIAYSNIAIIEAMAIHVAIGYAKKMKARNIAIHTDNLLCVQMIAKGLKAQHLTKKIITNAQVTNKCPSLLQFVLQKPIFLKEIQAIINKLRCFRNITIFHINRCFNKYADSLSKYSFSLFYKTTASHECLTRTLRHNLQRSLIASQHLL